MGIFNNPHKIIKWVIIWRILFFQNGAFARNIYLNGQDVSRAKNQLLENVTLQIDKDGNIYIEAPHYQVQEESTFIPLSQWQAMNHESLKNASKNASEIAKTQEPKHPASQPKEFQQKQGTKSAN